MAVKSPFDFIGSICSNNKTNLLEQEPESEKQYLPFIINRSLSYHQDAIMFANEMNKYPNLSKQAQYDFYRFGLRPRRRFSKWVKPIKDADVDLVAEYYNISKIRASEMVQILSKDALKEMRIHLDKGGVIR